METSVSILEAYLRDKNWELKGQNWELNIDFNPPAVAYRQVIKVTVTTELLYLEFTSSKDSKSARVCTEDVNEFENFLALIKFRKCINQVVIAKGLLNG